jgi:hypothetical protein
VIEALKLTISKLQHARHGASSERSRKLLDQLELQLAEFQESTAQDKAAATLNAAPAEASDAAKDAGAVKPARRSLPEHLPRERVVHPASSQCQCCGGALRKLGEDVTETLEYVPARWKLSSMSGRSSPAADARRLPRRRRRSIRSPAAVPDGAGERRRAAFPVVLMRVVFVMPEVDHRGRAVDQRRIDEAGADA